MQGKGLLLWAANADYSSTIEKVWQLALDTGANVLALNVIETAASGTGMVQKRNLLNDLIVHHEDDHLCVGQFETRLRLLC